MCFVKQRLLSRKETFCFKCGTISKNAGKPYMKDRSWRSETIQTANASHPTERRLPLVSKVASDGPRAVYRSQLPRFRRLWHIRAPTQRCSLTYVSKEQGSLTTAGASQHTHTRWMKHSRRGFPSPTPKKTKHEKLYTVPVFRLKVSFDTSHPFSY